MANKLVISKYLAAVSIGAFIAAFFTMVDKTYSNIKSTQEKIFEPYKTKINDPNLDVSFLDKLESQTHFKTSDLVYQPAPSATTSQTLTP